MDGKLVLMEATIHACPVWIDEDRLSYIRTCHECQRSLCSVFIVTSDVSLPAVNALLQRLCTDYQS